MTETERQTEVTCRLDAVARLCQAAIAGRLDPVEAIDGSLSLLVKADGFARGETVVEA